MTAHGTPLDGDAERARPPRDEGPTDADGGTGRPPPRRATPADRAAVCDLLGRVFGPRDDQEALFDLWLRDTARSVFVAPDGRGGVVGAGVCASLSAEQLARYGDITPALAPWAADEICGGLQLLAVAPEARRQGVGRALGAALFRDLRARGVSALVGVSWQNGSAATSAPLFEAAGFAVLGCSSTFYAEEQARSGQVCARCAGPCSCVALLYGRKRSTGAAEAAGVGD